MDYNLPDELDANYGSSDTPVVKMPGTARVSQPTHTSTVPANPYAQYGRTLPQRPKQQPSRPQPAPPTERIDGYNMQMINGVPNVAPLLINQVSPTPFNRGDFDPVYNLTGKPYNFAKGPTYQGYGTPYDGGIIDAWNSFWTKGIPAAPITSESEPEARMALGTALQYIGLLTAPTDEWTVISPALKQLQEATKIAQTGIYDAASQDQVARGFASKRQGKALDDVWSKVEESGVLPEWWNATPPSTDIVDYTSQESSTTNYLKYGLIALAILGGITGLALYMRKKRSEEL